MREIQIGLLGLGTVGSGVLEIIQRREKHWMEYYGFRPVIKKILVQNLTKKRIIPVNPRLLTTDWQTIVYDPEIEVVIEVISGEEPALTAAQAILQQGKYLVTANKFMLALHGPELFRLAHSNGVEIGFEGSVGGGIPLIQPLRESLNANEIESVQGIINGTTNYILTAMSEKAENYFDVLKKAQILGYAEADPSSDVEGWDACYKLSVLTGLAFGVQLPINQISTTGITELTLADLKMAQKLGYTIKLVASAKRNGGVLRGRVHPTLLAKGHPLAHVSGVNNALLIKGDAVGEVLFSGPGAGMLATGSAVTSDLVRICRMLTQKPIQIAKASDFRDSLPGQVPLFAPANTPIQEGRFFVTIKSVTKPEVGSIVANFSQVSVPIKSIFTADDTDLYHVGILTEQCTEQEIRAVIQNLSINVNYRKILYYYVEGGEK